MVETLTSETSPMTRRAFRPVAHINLNLINLSISSRLSPAQIPSRLTSRFRHLYTHHHHLELPHHTQMPRQSNPAQYHIAENEAHLPSLGQSLGQSTNTGRT